MHSSGEKPVGFFLWTPLGHLVLIKKRICLVFCDCVCMHCDMFFLIVDFIFVLRYRNRSLAEWMMHWLCPTSESPSVRSASLMLLQAHSVCLVWAPIRGATCHLEWLIVRGLYPSSAGAQYTRHSSPTIEQSIFTCCARFWWSLLSTSRLTVFTLFPDCCFCFTLSIPNTHFLLQVLPILPLPYCYNDTNKYILKKTHAV